MTDICVVGAGAAAAAATHVLDATTDADVTVLEKSRGLCGRAATRRRGDVTYDYGANYLTGDDERVAELVTETLDDAGLVEIAEPTYTLDGDGTVTEGRPPSGRRWSYRRGLTQLAKRLFGGTDADVHRETRVEALARHGDDWHLTGADGETWGPYDAVLLNPPAPQTAELLADADWDHDARDALAAAAGDVSFRTVWTAVLGYEFRVDAPYYAVVDPAQEHPVGWLAREECKAGHVPDGESVLVVQASGWWSAERYDAAPAENVAALADHAADVVGDDRLASPAWTDHQGWRYALPQGEVAPGPVDSAAREGLYVLGDWVDGEARLHGAVRSGLETGERVALSMGG
jgi:renalase